MSSSSSKLSGGGSVVLVGSRSQWFPPDNAQIAYASSKGALLSSMYHLVHELGPDRIRVNCIAPSLTDTPLASRLLSSDEKKSAMGKRHPLGRVGAIGDIAAMAEFLLSDQSPWITGQIFAVDGGMSTLRV